MATLTISDVQISAKQVPINQKFTISLTISGAQDKPFTFPFSNESLTEKLIYFIEVNKDA